jgi:membrane peptidoglycan carboxypeptidase
VGSFRTYKVIRRRRHGFRSGGGEASRMLPAWAVIFLCIFVVVVSISLIEAGWLFSSLTRDLPSTEGLPTWLDREKGSLLEPTRFYDRSGKTILSTLENPGLPRKFLSVDPSQPDHFSPQLTRAWVGLKQSDYWRSSGIATAALFDSKPRTIAENLVAMLLLEQEPEGTRKAVRMRLLASQVFQRYGTSQVLEWYLNSADFGHLAYGAESASQLYFGKSAADLDLIEAALLVVISESPALNPIDAPAHIEELQKEALNRLLLAGLIGSDEYIQRSSKKLEFAPASVQNPSAYFDYIDLVKSQLDETIGRERFERGGFKVITSLDLDLQEQLICTLQTQLGREQSSSSKSGITPACQAGRLLPSLLEQTGSTHENLSAEGVITNPQTGEVLAYSGEVKADGSFKPSGSHEPGSLLTPFVAAGAFARGYSPASLVWDIPVDRAATTDRLNYPEDDYHGPVSLRTAIANDYLTPIANIFDEIGGESLAQLWAPFGLRRISQSSLSSDLLKKGGALTLLQVAQAYGILADGGKSNGVSNGEDGVIRPKVIMAVEEMHGSVIPAAPADDSLPVLSEPLAYLINNVLSDESARKPSMGNANPLEIGLPSGGKAGQTVEGNSLWAVGYIPQRVAVTWLNQDGSSGSKPIDIRAATGITHALLQYAGRGMPNEGWRKPAGVSEVDVCDPSGELPTRDCPAVVKEEFLAGSEPTSTDVMYQRMAINRETGRLATVFTPPELQVENVFLMVPAAYRKWAEQASFPLAPTEYDTIQAPAFNPDVNISSPAVFNYVRGKTEILGTAKGDNFSEYRLEIGQGLNPNEWIQVGGGKGPVGNGLLGEWDTTGREGLYALRLIVVDQNQTYHTAVVQVAVDNTPPQASISYPQQGEIMELEKGSPVTLRADASDAIGISRVEWWLDKVRIGIREQPPFVLPWNSVAGDHTLVGRAFDLAGNMGESDPVEFTVK